MRGWDQTPGVDSGQPVGDTFEENQQPQEKRALHLPAFLRRVWDDPVTRREVLTGGLLGLGFLLVGVKLVQLQSFLTGDYTSLAQTERTAHQVVRAHRGTIYDRNGTVLAKSVDAVDIGIHPERVVDVNATANLIARVMGGDAATYAQKIRDAQPDEVKYKFFYLARLADPGLATNLKAEVAAVNKERSERGMTLIDGFEYEKTTKRLYPKGSIAGNLVGLVGVDGAGLCGLEYRYDHPDPTFGPEGSTWHYVHLTGTDGLLVEERSRNGVGIVGSREEYADDQVQTVDGDNLVLSIDIDIQQVAQQACVDVVAKWDAQYAMAICMNPRNGEIYACCSTPYLDPNDLSTIDPLNMATTLRPITQAYEPGSTTKPLVASMAIELGIATPTTTYKAPPMIQVGDDWVGDADSRSYEMDMPLTNMLERSSNVGAVLCATSVGPDVFASFYEQYGLGNYTYVDYSGESMGTVAKRRNYTGAWQAMAFGQAMSVAPIQIARAIGTIANEGIRPNPHFLVSRNGVPIEWGQGPRVISTSTAQQVAWMMNSVTVNGYGSGGACEGYNVASKTGTAERVNEETGLYFEDKFLVSFIGFAPTEDPKVLTYVLIDYVPIGGSGADTAAEPFHTIMEAALEKLKVPKSS